jgi:D-alanyl-lipoteichoic acid acyltransferase DltB (MBOAT superfamily)
MAIFLIGLLKKVLLADPLSVMSRDVFGAVASGQFVSSWETWIGALAYTGQIYFDFSGYSDMAIGLARMFGIKFPQNFDSPYQVGSIIEFWRRWHITLTRFFREYVYFPLGGNRCGLGRQGLNTMITMGLSGLWHGAGWTFVLWGLAHGVMLVGNNLFRHFCRTRDLVLGRWWRGAFAVLTFGLLVFTWVLFRAENLIVAQRMWASLLGVGGFTIPARLEQNVGGLVRIFGGRFEGEHMLTARMGWDIAQVLAVLLIAWTLPNTQQLLASWEPIFEKVRPAAGWVWRPGWAFGFLVGAGFFLVCKGYFTLRPTEFLYFNF